MWQRQFKYMERERRITAFIPAQATSVPGGSGPQNSTEDALRQGQSSPQRGKLKSVSPTSMASPNTPRQLIFKVFGAKQDKKVIKKEKNSWLWQPQHQPLLAAE